MFYYRAGLPCHAPVLRTACLLLAALCMQTAALADWHRQQRDIMGTRISIDLWHSDAELAENCSESVFTEIRRIDALMSSHRGDSELSFINNNAIVAAVEISDEMSHLIERSAYFSGISHGAFDITYASIGHAYNFRDKKRPGAALLAAKLPAIDYRHIEHDDNRIRFRNSGVRIDLGGIAKGYAVDRAIEIVGTCGIARAMVSAGGDSRILGDRDGHPWLIGIQHPRDPDSLALRVPLADTALSTSGDYQRFFIDDGERVHHIIDPTTGLSAVSSWSTTVTGPNAMTTDALSTTIFVLGAVRGLELIESLDGIDAIIIDNNGKIHYSSGFQAPGTEG